MTDQHDIDTQICNTADTVSTDEATVVADVSPVEESTAATPTNRRASFAAEQRTPSKPPRSTGGVGGSGGIDSLGRGYLP